MPIVPAKLKAAMEVRVYNELKAAFAKDGAQSPDADKNWQAIAKAVSATAEDICLMLLTDVQVAPGQAVVGAGGGIPGPMSGATTSPGKLL
jgi:hypothetical protein